MPKTRFAEFMEANEEMRTVDIATRAHVDVTFVSGLLNDSVDPPLPEMIAITRAASAILGRPVRITELFDLGYGER